MARFRSCDVDGWMTRKACIDSATQGRLRRERQARAPAGDAPMRARAPDRAAEAQGMDQLAASTGDQRYRHAASILRAPSVGRTACADDASVIEVQWMIDT